MSTRAKVSPGLDPVEHAPGAAVRRLDRAHDRARYATSAIPSRRLAEHWGVSPARARSLRTRDRTGSLTQTLALIADPEVDAGPLVAAVLAAFEERHLLAPTDVLRARLRQLRDDEEHRLEMEQNRATVTRCAHRTDAYRQHAAALIEMATIEELLGVEETAH